MENDKSCENGWFSIVYIAFASGYDIDFEFDRLLVFWTKSLWQSDDFVYYFDFNVFFFSAKSLEMGDR